ncbi:hypothetical protein MAR_024342 [Mya arenaria]|uniref:Uncharacterized protein n=1 Tax=Mya arenaria TaxID=6604 RepID=A0ABY7DRC8_MYAAR|nr:uncharacterized protein LOC128226560 isoform X2 [Mya arenaria]WAQ99969.1 hypothetical protein MAR_024342 [Mya arenaria]
MGKARSKWEETHLFTRLSVGLLLIITLLQVIGFSAPYWREDDPVVSDGPGVRVHQGLWLYCVCEDSCSCENIAGMPDGNVNASWLRWSQGLEAVSLVLMLLCCLLAPLSVLCTDSRDVRLALVAMEPFAGFLNLMAVTIFAINVPRSSQQWCFYMCAAVGALAFVFHFLYAFGTRNRLHGAVSEVRPTIHAQMVKVPMDEHMFRKLMKREGMFSL